MTTHHRIRGRRAALAATTALALLGTATVPALAAATIDPSATAQLTVHAFEQPEAATGLPHDGSQLPPVLLTGLTPLAGAEFSVQQVPGVDLTTSAGWQLAGDMTVAAAQGAVAGVLVQSEETGVDGLAVFDELPLGLYLVTETGTPAGAATAAPFLVTLPLTHPTARDTWLYDVHVYPKTATTGATKTVDDTGATTIGDTITWTITGDIPNGGRTDAYRVVDPLDDALAYGSTSIALSDGTAVVEGTHYSAVHDPDTHTVTIDFTDAGLDLLAAHDSAQVVVTLTTSVRAVGAITNVAAVYPNRSTIDAGNPVSTPAAETRFGNVTVQKVDQSDAALAGARFQVFRTLADARAGTDPIAVDGTSSWTSGSDGRLTISGLRYSNFEAGAELVSPGAWQHYWLVEVAAPEGFELLAQPVQIDVTSTDTTVDLTVENVPSNSGFTLPLTGANGTALIVLAGSLLLVGAVLLAVRTRAQKAAATA